MAGPVLGNVLVGCRISCVLAVLSVTSLAPAQQAAADTLFDEGRALMEAGRHEEAIPKLKDSNRLDAAPGTLLNLAECYVKTRRTASAWSTYKEAAALAATAGQKDRERFAQESAEALRPGLSTVTVVVPPASRVPGLSITVNGSPVPDSLFGQAFPVDPGPVRLDASAPGKVAVSASGELRPDAHSVTFNVAPLAPMRPAPTSVGVGSPPPDAAPMAEEGTSATAPVASVSSASGASGASGASMEDPGASQKLTAYVVGAVGIVGVGVGTGLYLRSQSTLSDSRCPDERCVVGVGDPGLHETGRAQEKVAIGVFAGGLALLTGGAVLYFTAPSAPAGESAVRLDLNVDAAGTRVTAFGRF